MRQRDKRKGSIPIALEHSRLGRERVTGFSFNMWRHLFVVSLKEGNKAITCMHGCAHTNLFGQKCSCLVSGTFEKFCLDKALPRSAKEVIKTHQLLTNASQNTSFLSVVLFLILAWLYSFSSSSVSKTLWLLVVHR